jgi:hypothetical protein
LAIALGQGTPATLLVGPHRVENQAAVVDQLVGVDQKLFTVGKVARHRDLAADFCAAGGGAQGHGQGHGNDGENATTHTTSRRSERVP